MKRTDKAGLALTVASVKKKTTVARACRLLFKFWTLRFTAPFGRLRVNGYYSS